MTARTGLSEQLPFFQTTLNLQEPYIDWRGNIYARYSDDPGRVKLLSRETEEFCGSVLVNIKNGLVVTDALFQQVDKVGQHLIALYRSVDAYTRSTSKLFVYYSTPGLNPDCSAQIRKIIETTNTVSQALRGELEFHHPLLDLLRN